MVMNLEADGIRTVPEEIDQILESCTERVRQLLELAERYGCAGDPPDALHRPEQPDE